ncbi:OLC1v1024380C1 [Oldenlandia corymbosa var. corymbosa]|uniref:OLC1v1024380C1 n=1 Tax=Oldenlandia corymbosa var. corymbosa TaxID=529605 RepID=A0AAV1C3K5_OLDCO|nr:OLC1v1024380C1 [Oldenlandia corymbosa var. corymbosa]
MNHARNPAFPVHQKNFIVEIEGNTTDVVLCSYDDHFFVLVTQIGSMGTILHARKEESALAEPTFEVSVVFGKYDEPMIMVCGRQLIEHISKFGSSKSLILSLGLKDHSRATIKGVISAVTKNCLW